MYSFDRVLTLLDVYISNIIPAQTRAIACVLNPEDDLGLVYASPQAASGSWCHGSYMGARVVDNGGTEVFSRRMHDFIVNFESVSFK